MAEGLDLSGAAVLAGLTPKDVGELERVAVLQDYDTDAAIFTEGEAAYGMCIVLAGRVTLRSTLGAEQVEVGEATTGDLIGWSGLVPPHDFTATAVATEPTRIAVLKADDLARLSEEDQYLGRILMRNVASIISGRLREAHTQSAELIQQLRDYVPSGKALHSRRTD
ncbi:MAG: Crp/Fnr family transcriptional regulator [Thermoleophilia bacterium]